MDTEDLRTFVEVADAGGVSPAARRLGVAKSIVSRRLMRLEADLGIQLLARTTRGASLTEAGAAFRDYAARIAAEVDSARETVLPEGELRGRLRISCALTLGPTHFAPVFAEMARRHPRLSIQTCYTDQRVDLVAEGYDCGIRLGYLPDSNLIARRFAPILGKLVASPTYVAEHGEPETPHEVVRHEALMQGTEPWYFLDGDKTVTIHAQGRFKADNAAALVAACVKGIGLAFVPNEVTDVHIASGALVQVMKQYPPPPAAAYVVRPPGQHPSRKIRVLTELLIEHCNPPPQAG